MVHQGPEQLAAIEGEIICHAWVGGRDLHVPSKSVEDPHLTTLQQVY